MSKPDSESPAKPDKWLERVKRIGIAQDIVPIPGRSEFAGIRDVTLGWNIIHCYVPLRGEIVFINRWEYKTYDAAKKALDAWMASKGRAPEGWVRQPLGQRNGRTELLKSISK